MAKGWQVIQLGEPEEALSLNNIDVPVPNENETLIKVNAAALNFFDILQCQGNYQEKHPLPFTPGAEISGIVEQVGLNSKFNIGDRVLATPRLPNGGLAEKVVVNEADVYPLPNSMNDEAGASFYITYHTAYFALKKNAYLKENETLLVHAGSGGVGSAAIQIGKALGAKVIATAGTEKKLSVCKDLGADVVVNYEKEDFVEVVNEITNGKGADVIFDPVGGETLNRSRRCIAFKGRLVVIGFASGTIAKVPTNHILIKNYAVVGVHFGYFRELYPEKVRQQHKELVQLYENGSIDPLIYKVYDFDKVPYALRELASRKTYGKLVVKP